MSEQSFLKILAGLGVFILGFIAMAARLQQKVTKNTMGGLKGRLIASGIMVMISALIYLFSLL